MRSGSTAKLRWRRSGRRRGGQPSLTIWRALRAMHDAAVAPDESLRQHVAIKVRHRSPHVSLPSL